MVEIKFRGKRIDNEQWVIGDLSHSIYSDGRKNITMWEQTPCAELNINIYKNTIGQYIGLKTILDNREIYVGDLLKDEEGFIWEVLNLGDGMFKISCSDLMGVESAYPRVVACEIVGNIHDNHEDDFKNIIK